MIKIALTGNIASGKSTVQNILEKKGYKVLDTDKVAHKLLSVKNSLLYEVFKPYDVFENGEFSREKLGRLVFSNIEIRTKLESILHPQIAVEIEQFFKNNESEKLTFVGIPLLFEAEMSNLFDKIIFVYADDAVRLERLIKRNNYSPEYAKTRLDSQMSQDEKLQKSDFILFNTGTIEELNIQITKLLNELSN